MLLSTYILETGMFQIVSLTWTALALVAVSISMTSILTDDSHSVLSQWWVFSEFRLSLQDPKHEIQNRLLCALALCTTFHWYWALTTPTAWVNLWCAWFYSILWLLYVPIAAMNGFAGTSIIRATGIKHAQAVLLDCFGLPCVAVGVSLNSDAAFAPFAVLAELVVRWTLQSQRPPLWNLHLGWALACLLSLGVLVCNQRWYVQVP